MTILDRSTNIQRQIQERNRLRLAYKNAEAFRARATELRELRENFSDAIARLDVLKVRGVLPPVIPSSTNASAIVTECQVGLAGNPDEIGKDYGRLKRALDKLARDVLGVAAKVIDTVQRDLPSVDETFLKQVELVPGYQTKIQNIRQQRAALLQGTDPKQSAQALAQFLDRRKDLRALADDLRPTEFPQEVLDFFKAGRQGQGAPLEKFTSGVQKWLSARGLLGNVRVTVIAK
jgi:hypothetical protein